VLASLDKTCPNCGFVITPDLVKRVDFSGLSARNAARSLRLRADVISRIELVCCEQSAVAMRVVARLASVKLAFLSWLDTTGWTRDRGNLLWGKFFAHGRGTIPRTCARRRHASAQY
jgi:hypothetical protein